MNYLRAPMKKWLIFLFLFISVAGTFIPCCQVDSCCADQLAASGADHQDHEEEGTCSPFFACATCPGFVELVKPFYLEKPIAVEQVHHEKSVIFDFPTYSASFWQPPRVCLL